MKVIVVILMFFGLMLMVHGSYKLINYFTSLEQENMTCEQIFESKRSLDQVPVKCLIIKSRENSK